MVEVLVNASTDFHFVVLDDVSDSVKMCLLNLKTYKKQRRIRIMD